MPKPATVEDEIPALVSPITEQPTLESSIAGRVSATIVPESASQTSYQEPPVNPLSVNELQGRFEELLINHPRFTALSSSPPCYPAKRSFAEAVEIAKGPTFSATEVPVARGSAARDKWFAELAAVSDQRQHALRNKICPHPANAVSIFSVYCNNCSRPIPNEHYHCSTCDDGDFDLCQACVDDGVLCGGDDHWMIKRAVQGGKVISSVTEKIAPKPVASESKTTLVQPEEEEEDDVATRTCNSCIQGKNSYHFGCLFSILTCVCRIL